MDQDGPVTTDGPAEVPSTKHQVSSPHRPCLRRVAFGLVTAAIVLLVGRRIFDCATTRSRRRPTKSSRLRPALVGVLLEEAREPVVQLLDDVRADRVVEHRRRADLHRAAAEQEVVQRVLEGRRCRRCPRSSCPGNACVSCDIFASDSGRIAGPPRPPVETSPSTLHLEVERLGVDERQRREGVGRHDRVGAAEKRAARLDDDVGRGRRELGPDRNPSRPPSPPSSRSRRAPCPCRRWSPCRGDPCAGTTGSARARRSPRSWHAVASVCQCRSSVSLPEPAMIDATST